jgi:hypothetical protein
MITEKELVERVQCTFNKSSNHYNSPNGAFLEVIRDFAAQERIENIAEAIKIYTENNPNIDKLIAISLPGILSNCYFATLKDFSFEKFLEWSALNSDWRYWIKDNRKNSEGLALSVQKIRQEVSNC